jgi:hypothetical protein
MTDLDDKLDRLCLWLAIKMPRRLRYWATVRSGAIATQGQWGDTVVPEVKFMEVLKRIEKRR